MVSLTTVQASNSLISSTFPPKLVALFVGATSGIGETTLFQFAKHTVQPRVYIVGRSQEAADRNIATCRTLNPEGEFYFIKADVSLIKNVDEVCETIKAKEKVINLLVLSAGVASLDRSKTSEGLHLLAAMNYYSRLRLISNLLPLIRTAPSLRRVLVVAGGSKEGPIDATDFQALRVSLFKFRGHLTSMITLGLEAVAKSAPEVSFVHSYPGTVRTPLQDQMPFPLRWALYWFGRWICVPLKESGERHLYEATSARYPPLKEEGVVGVVEEDVEKAIGSTGERGSGVYSVTWDCESASPAVLKVLADEREKGMVGEVWRHTEGEFRWITERKP